MLLHTGDRVVQSKNGLVATSCAQVKAKEFALEGSVFIGGAVVQWLRDELQFFTSSSEIEKLAASCLDSGDVFLVPAFTGLGAAYLAGLTVDLWKSREELATHWQVQKRFEPRMERKEAESKLARWREAVTRARSWTPA